MNINSLNNIQNFSVSKNNKTNNTVTNPNFKAQEKLDLPQKQMVNAQIALAYKMPMSFKDSVQGETLEINTKLEKIYGIKSDVQNPKLLQLISNCIEDFCTKNNNSNLFAGLKIDEKRLEDNKEEAEWNANYDTKEFKITFNSNFDWDNIERITKENYENGYIASNNPKYNVYKQLGAFLNFDYNPYAFKFNNQTNIKKENNIHIMRIGYPISKINDFNAHYIAAKMCSVELPKSLDEFFDENVGNTYLNLENNISQKNIGNNNQIEFESLEKAQKYLKDTYGINANFENLSCANDCIAAVKDLAKLTNDKNIFNGLEIITSAESFHNTSTPAGTEVLPKTGNARIHINPAYNWAKSGKIALNKYNEGYYPSSESKGNFIHELCHYIDVKENMNGLMMARQQFKENNHKFDNNVLNAVSKVSLYATYSPMEFFAEYITGKLSGYKYPKCTNDEFEKYWHGPKLNWNTLIKND